MELCLGTVQFGMSYGIRNQQQPLVQDAVAMLDYAVHNGINTIDTANAYGTAEDVVGEFLKKEIAGRTELFVISKFRPNLLDEVQPDQYYSVMKKNLENSLCRLHTDYLDAYMLHSSRYVWNDEIIDTLERMKKEGYVRHIGVSVYEPDEAKKVLERKNCDFMQLPYSIFDQRMKKEQVFDKAKEVSNTQIHSRSAFIQGLILMSENEIPEFLKEAKPIVRKIDEFCKTNNLSRIALALSYVKREQSISHLVFGVDNLTQLKENIELFSKPVSNDMIEAIAKDFEDIKAEVVMPSLWKR